MVYSAPAGQESHGCLMGLGGAIVFSDIFEPRRVPESSGTCETMAAHWSGNPATAILTMFEPNR